MWTRQKTEGELLSSVMVSSSCSTDGTSWCHRKYAIIVNLSFEKSAENVNGSPW